MIGQTISHYRIVEKLGEGGMGVVYKAEDTKLKRTVALKFLPRSLETHEPERARFLQEAQAAAALNHPNICTIYDIALGEGPEGSSQQFIVMEYVEGVTLRQKVESCRASSLVAPSVNDAITHAIQIGEALQEAHSKGIVHRDVKAENIMVNTKKQVKVMDFGLAKLKGSLKLTRTSSTAGTLAYMAPEQIEGGEVDARSDIFSFGVVLYETLTGHLPFRGEHEAAMMYSILNEEPHPVQDYLPDAPSELLHVLNRALEKDPEDRYQTVHDMVIDLRRLKKETTRVVRTSAAMRPSEVSVEELKKHSEGLLQKKWIRPAAVGGGVLVVLLLAYFVVWPAVESLLFRTERIPIAVITFENQTGEAQYDYLRAAIPNLLITSLEQSTALRVTTWERMRDLLKQMGRSDAEVINTDLGFELCRRDSVRALVTGSFVKMGDMFATDVKVIDVESKALLKSAGSKGEGVGSILKVQIDELGNKIAAGFGLPERRVASEQKPIADVTTSSMEAYNLYLRGVQEVEKLAFQDGRRTLERALIFDSTFAMAHLWLGFVCSNLGDRPALIAAFERAFRFSARATRKEKLFIESYYARVVEADQGKQYRILKELEHEFPKEKMVHLVLGMHFEQEDAVARFHQVLALDPGYGPAMFFLGYEYMRRGDYTNSLVWLKRYAAASPGEPNPYDSMGDLHFSMGELDEAIANYKKTVALKPDFLATHPKIAYAHALLDKYDEALDWINKMRLEVHDEGSQFNATLWQALYEHWLGHNASALLTVSAASKAADRAKNRLWEGMAKRALGVLLSSRGEFEKSRRALAEARDAYMAVYPMNAPYYTAFYGLLSARTELSEGRLNSVEGALAAASTTMPKLTGVNHRWLSLLHHQIQGELLMAKGRMDEAVRHWRDHPELVIDSSFDIRSMVPLNLAFPRDGLAKALVKKGELDSGIAEYERLTRFDPSSKDRRLVNPLHRYELAKLYEKRGLKGKAVEQYEKFIALWRNSDPDRPEPKDAGKRLARLK